MYPTVDGAVDEDIVEEEWSKEGRKELISTTTPFTNLSFVCWSCHLTKSAALPPSKPKPSQKLPPIESNQIMRCELFSDEFLGTVRKLDDSLRFFANLKDSMDGVKDATIYERFNVIHPPTIYGFLNALSAS